MKMEHRRPRRSRFGTESKEARLAHLREQAPSLGSNRRLRIYAMFGAVLLALTVAAFYFAMQIYRAAGEQRHEGLFIEVDQAPEIVESETAKAVKRLEEEGAAEEARIEELVESLKEVDLLEDLEAMEEPITSSGQ